jgi:hypothetical protein
MKKNILFTLQTPLIFLFAVSFTGCHNFFQSETESELYKSNGNHVFHVKVKAIKGKTAEDIKTEEVRILIQKVFFDIREGNSNELVNSIDPKLGVYIDYDAPRTYSAFIQDMKNADSFSYAVIFDTEKLQKITKDENQKSVRHLLLKNNSVEVELFFEGDGKRCEVKYHLTETPSESFRFNNSVLILKDKSWKFWQLF